jgi:hypothetical protein
VEGSTLNRDDFVERLNTAVAVLHAQEAVKLAEHYLGSGEWRAYIQEQMSKAPEDVSYAQYLAMIEIFGRLIDKDKAKFIEMAYKQSFGYSDAENPKMLDSLIATNTQNHAYYELSPVFAEMAKISWQRLGDSNASINYLADTNSEIHEKIYTSRLLTNIALYGQTLFYVPFNKYQNVLEDKFEVLITEPKGKGMYERLTGDCTFTINGYTTKDGIIKGYQNCNQEFSFTIYQYRDCDTVDSVLKEIAKNIYHTMIPNVDLQSEILDTMTEAIIGRMPFCDIVGVVFSGVHLTESYAKANKARGIANEGDKILDYGELAKAAHFGATITILPNGTFNTDFVCFDEEKLSTCLRDYEEARGQHLDVDDVISRIQSGNIFNKDGEMHGDLEAYVKWHASHNLDK